MRRTARLILATAMTLAALPAAAQFAKTEDAIKYRQSALTVMSEHFGRLGAMVKGKVPYDAATATADAEVVSMVSKLPWAGFAPGTEGGKAKPEIWKEPAKFKENQQKLIAATGNLVTGAKAGNLEALKTAFGATGETCKACHDQFRDK